MTFRHQGNGDRKVEVEFIDHPGYVLVAPKNPTPFPAAIALVINDAVVDWTREQKDIRVRAVLPITERGNAVAVHVRYDRADGVARLWYVWLAPVSTDLLSYEEQELLARRVCESPAARFSPDRRLPPPARPDLQRPVRCRWTDV